MLGCKFAPSTQSYLELTRPRSTQMRAIPPMPLVNKTKVDRFESFGSFEGCGSGAKKTDRGGDFLRNCGITFQNQFGIRRSFLWRETGNVAIANRDGLNVNRDGIFTFQSRSKWRGVLNEQPMMRRHKRNPAAVNQCPCDNARENFPCLTVTQNFSQRGFHAAGGEFAGGSEKTGWRVFDLPGEPEPVGSVKCFNRRDFAQGFQRPCGLSVGAAVSIATQTLWRRCRRKAITSAGIECKSDFIFPCGKFRKRLAEEINLESWIANCGVRKESASFPFQCRYSPK